MNTFMTWSLAGVLALVGCKSGTAGGPGATNAGTQPLMGQADETFRLVMPEAVLRQGETKSIAITIKRALNFNEDVKLEFGDLPQGLSLDDRSPVINHGDTEARLLLTAADDASLGDFSIKVTGRPTNGSDSTNELKVTVTTKNAK